MRVKKLKIHYGYCISLNLQRMNLGAWFLEEFFAPKPNLMGSFSFKNTEKTPPKFHVSKTKLLWSTLQEKGKGNFAQVRKIRLLADSCAGQKHACNTIVLVAYYHETRISSYWNTFFFQPTVLLYAWETVKKRLSNFLSTWMFFSSMAQWHESKIFELKLLNCSPGLASNLLAISSHAENLYFESQLHGFVFPSSETNE